MHGEVSWPIDYYVCSRLVRLRAILPLVTFQNHLFSRKKTTSTPREHLVYTCIVVQGIFSISIESIQKVKPYILQRGLILTLLQTTCTQTTCTQTTCTQTTCTQTTCTQTTCTQTTCTQTTCTQPTCTQTTCTQTTCTQTTCTQPTCTQTTCTQPTCTQTTCTQTTCTSAHSCSLRCYRYQVTYTVTLLISYNSSRLSFNYVISKTTLIHTLNFHRNFLFIYILMQLQLHASSFKDHRFQHVYLEMCTTFVIHQHGWMIDLDINPSMNCE